MTDERVLVTFWEDVSVVKMLDHVAEVKGTTRSAILRSLVRDYVERELTQLKEKLHAMTVAEVV